MGVGGAIGFGHTGDHSPKMGGIISKKDNSLEAQHCRPLGLYPK